MSGCAWPWDFPISTGEQLTDGGILTVGKESAIALLGSWAVE